MKLDERVHAMVSCKCCNKHSDLMKEKELLEQVSNYQHLTKVYDTRCQLHNLHKHEVIICKQTAKICFAVLWRQVAHYKFFKSQQIAAIRE